MKQALFLCLYLSTYSFGQVVPWTLATATPCDNWLYLPSQPSYVGVGDLDIPGNKLTVEAMFNRTTPYTGGSPFAGDVVSKHDTPADVNYLLRPNHAEITTTNGYFKTPDICEIQLNKIYHVAMVYDGSTLKFYRNGFLMSQVAATGNLIQNNWETRIGFYEHQLYNENLIGYINDVRLWNVARTQTQIQASMNSPLPLPSSQTGLLAYYVFNDLTNKQGNPAWNGTLGGSASINSINTNCNFIADSCAVSSNIINDYTPVLALNPCDNKITVEDASAFNAGDTVLMIQMKGAIIDSSNTSNFGTITDYKNAGNYEFNYVKIKSGNVIELKNTLTRQYDIPTGKVQLVRVPYYQNANITSTLTCLPWDGSKGGVLVLNSADSIILNSNIDASGKGFSGAVGYNPQNTTLNCFQNSYNYPISSNGSAGQKGESITTISNNIICGKGSPAGGGGGGLGHNSGGGGGANGGQGGFGGYQLEPCGNSPYDNRGIGGHLLAYNSSTNKIFMGSGGGAGHSDNAGNLPSGGGNGGGIIIIISNFLKSNTYKILSNGNTGVPCIMPPSADCHDGMGGGGAGGALLLNVNQILGNTSVENKGGKGADMIGSVPLGGRIGGGGGGSGGLLFLKSNSLPANLLNINTGGVNGVLTTDNNNAWGATPGQNGTTLFNLQIPTDNIPFKPNIDSTRIKDSASGCSSFDFNGLSFTNTNPINTWQWYFGDGGTGNAQNTNHTYPANGTYTVKLLVTDINGCQDSISKTVTTANVPNFDFNYQLDVCNPLSVQFSGIGNNIQNPYWVFSDATTSSGNLNPVHTFPALGSYTIKYSVTSGTCTDTLTKTIDLAIIPDDIILTPDTTICFGSTKQLRTKSSLSFCWDPTTYLNNPNLPNPTTSTPQNITYYFTAQVTGTNVITNGDFSGGNVGFTSEYNYANPNITEGDYFVGTNPTAWNPLLSTCKDHTSGGGNMMLVNGSPAPNVNVWKQTVTVIPNTNYAFSTWIQALWPPNPAQLQFSINGKDIGTAITASLPTCTLTQFYTTWNSGSNTIATISIVNKNTQIQGNDFALDDISFAPVFVKRDSVVISVETPVVKANNDTAACEGIQIPMNATGGASYSWFPSSGLSNPDIANPVATPVFTTQYIVNGTTINGCIAKDTVNITVYPKPAIAKSNDTAICKNSSVQLFASGGIIYDWSPVATLSNTSIPGPVATPAVNTTYYITVTDNKTCKNTDSIKVSIRPDPVFTISSSANVCENNSVQLIAGGGSVYSWQPAGSLNNPAISNPTALPQTTTNYSVQIIDTICNNTATLSTTITVLPLPIVKAGKSNDLDCSYDFSQLTATGAFQYHWSPANSLNNAGIANPVARPTTQTLYIVKGTDPNGCINYDSVTVNITGLNKGGYVMPNAFTPNNDGKNDCYGVKYWGIIEELDFGIYNRWGERIFHTTRPGDCWDGTYKGKQQNPDVYVYLITAKTICGKVFRKGTFVLIR
jgi:gliding motility-associated-like protein